MANLTRAENLLVEECFEAVDELLDNVAGKPKASVVKEPLLVGIKSQSLSDRQEKLIDELFGKIDSLKKFKSNKIARLINKNRLSGDEAIALLVLCSSASRGRSSIYLPYVVRILSKDAPVAFFEKLKIFSPESRLIKGGVLEVAPDEPIGSVYPDRYIVRLSAKAIAELTGVNAPKKTRAEQNNKVENLSSKALTAETLKSAKQLYGELSRYVVGQDEAKKTISVAVYNHYRRLEHKEDGKPAEGKSNIMFLGPTGCGKTYIVKTLAKILDVPFVVVDATSFTKAGYVGDKIDDCLSKLYRAAGSDLKRAAKGIVYIDEIDKLAAHKLADVDVSGKGVQEDLLKLLEGGKLKMSNGPRFGPIEIDTTNVLFIVGGAFSGIEMHSDEMTQNKGYGFASVGSEFVAAKSGVITVSALIKYGMMPEFLGRLPVLAQLNELSEDELVEVLKGESAGLINEYVSVFKKNNVRLIIADDAVRMIAKEAKEKMIGARGLRSIMEGILKPYMFELFSKDNPACVLEIGAKQANYYLVKEEASRPEFGAGI